MTSLTTMTPITTSPKAERRPHYELYYAVVYRDWETAKDLLTNHPNVMKLTEYSSNHRGETALHNACWWGGPLHIIKLIYDVNPALLMQLDDNLRSPLRYACGYASKEVVEFLIDAAPMAARFLDSDGLLPIHVAIKNRRAPSIVQNLLDVYPESFHLASHSLGRVSESGQASSNERKTPLEILSMKWNDDLCANINHLEYLTEGMDCDGLTTLKGSLYHLMEAYFRTTAFQRGYSNDATSSNGKADNSNSSCSPIPNFLHQSLQLNTQILPNIFKELIALTSPSEKCAETDEEGNLPLHIAATLEAENSNLIDILLKHDPEGANKQNKEGKFPLTLAVESGKSWDGIQQLVAAAPHALSTMDEHTKLYPFMLAASCTSSTTSLKEIDSLNLTYELLRLFPELIQNCIK